MLLITKTGILITNVSYKNINGCTKWEFDWNILECRLVIMSNHQISYHCLLVLIANIINDNNQ